MPLFTLNNLRGWARILLILACWFAVAGHAGDQPLTLRAAIALTLEHNPDVQSAGFALRAQDARTRQAGLRPLPTLEVEVENLAGSGDFAGVDTAETTFALAQTIELGGKRAARLAAAHIGRDVVSVEQQAAQLDVLAEVTRRFTHVAADQEQILLTRSATRLARQMIAAVEMRVKAGKSPVAELSRARIALARAQVDEEHAEHELLTSRRKLAAMWGAEKLTFGAISADFYSMPTPVTFAHLEKRLHDNPDFLRFVSEARLRDAEIRLAQAQRTPDLRLSGGVRRFEGSDDHALVIGFSMPLFTRGQAAPGIAEARALRGQTEAQRRAAENRAKAQLFELSQELQHAISETALLRDKVLPEMEKILNETRTAYQRGRYSYLEWVATQREFIDVRRSLIEAATRAHNYHTEIERLTGEPFSIANG